MTCSISDNELCVFVLCRAGLVFWNNNDINNDNCITILKVALTSLDARK